MNKHITINGDNMSKLNGKDSFTNHSTLSYYSQIQEKQVYTNFEKFFLWISNVDMDIMNMCPQSDKKRYVVIGLLLLLLSLLSCFSSFYAVSEAHLFNDNLWLQIIFAVLIAMIIFNIDRFIVSSFILDPELNFWKKLSKISTVTRLLLSILIGLIISTPIEIKLFEDKIMNSINENKKRALQELNDKSFIDRNLHMQIIEQDKIISQLKREMDSLYKMEEREANILNKKGIGYTNIKLKDEQGNDIIKKVITPRGKIASEAIDQLRVQTLRTTHLLGMHQKNRDSLNMLLISKSNNDKNKYYALENEKRYGLLEKHQYLMRVAGSSLIRIIVMVFFIMLDLIPVLAKLTSKGEYDLILYTNYVNNLNKLKTEMELNKINSQLELNRKMKEYELYNIQQEHDINIKANEYKMRIEEANYALNSKKLYLQQKLSEEKENYERENKEREISFQTEMELKKLNEENKMNQEKIRNEQEIETMKREYLLNNKDAIIEEIKTKHQLEGIEAQNKRMSEKEQLLHQMEIDKEKIKFKESIESMIALIQKYTNAYNTFFHKQNEA